ncbi:hypothetical protein IKF84_02420 [Candidatus Saccharibacteria bacterium]|nr:hypothetical protein [Candidatus Saccharibacteria bacterium]
MAQEIFKTEEKRKREELESQVKKAISLWRNNAAEYRSLPLKYDFLLNEKRAANIKPLKAVSKRMLDEYPKIPLFDLFTEEEAKIFIEDLKASGELGKTIEKVEFVLSTNYTYNTLKDWVKETRYELSKIKYRATKKAALCQKSTALAGAF